jgi:hypothetical protein
MKTLAEEYLEDIRYVLMDLLRETTMMRKQFLAVIERWEASDNEHHKKELER